jgi:hypothetical protein
VLVKTAGRAAGVSRDARAKAAGISDAFPCEFRALDPAGPRRQMPGVAARLWRPLINDLFVPYKVLRAFWPALETVVPAQRVGLRRQGLVSMGLTLKIVSQNSPGRR